MKTPGMLLAALVLPLLAAGCAAAPAKTEPARDDDTLKIEDGAAASGFLTRGGGWPKSKTLVELAPGADRKKLVVRFHCFLKTGLKPDIRGTKDDDTAIFGGECVELFLSPRPETGRYFHFAVNPGAAMYSAIGQDPSWTPDGIGKKVSFPPGRWILELSIPFKTLGVPPPARGEVWKANFCRFHRAADFSEASNWTGAVSHHDPAGFGRIAFAKPETEARFTLENFEASPSAVKCSLGLANIREPFRVEITRGDFTSRTEFLPKAPRIDIEAGLPGGYLPIKDSLPAAVRVVSASSGKTVFSKTLRCAAGSADMLLPDRFYYTPADGSVKFRLTAPSVSSAKKFSVRLLKDGKTVSRLETDSGSGEFPLAGLEPGRYVLEAANGNVRTTRVFFLGERHLPVPELPGRPRLSIDGDMFRVNGSPAFLLGASSTGKAFLQGKPCFNLAAGNFGVLNSAVRIGGVPGKKLIGKPATGYLYQDMETLRKTLAKHLSARNREAPVLHRITYEAQLKAFFRLPDGSLSEKDPAAVHREIYAFAKKTAPGLIFTVQTDSPGHIASFVPACDAMEITPSGGYSDHLMTHIPEGMESAKRLVRGKPVIFWIGGTIPNNRCRLAEELRAAVFLDIIRGGAGAIFHMGHGHLPAERSRLWSLISHINGEIQSFYPEFRALPVPDPEKAPAFSGTAFAAAVRGDGKSGVALAVNLSPAENTLTLKTRGYSCEADGKRFEGKEHSFDFTPYEARVFRFIK